MFLLLSHIFQSGLVFVDTPGIGENEFLESELMNFIHDNVILGFIYIIKTDNAGGVQEDRVSTVQGRSQNENNIICTQNKKYNMHIKGKLLKRAIVIFSCVRFPSIESSPL